ncbi:MAG TPA: hypothetical protein VL068_04295 [Microthrixaceae bacterium]|nr:hypothetical protein [Microthrixaceae bacterium]
MRVRRRPRRSRAHKVRLVFGWLVIVVAVSVVVVETAGRSVTERIAEDQIRSAGVAGGVEVTIGRSWWQPSISGVLIFGTLDRVDVRLSDARLYSTPVHEADYVLNGLGLDLSIRDRTVKATSLDSGSVRVLIDPSVIATMLGSEAVVRNGKMFLNGSDAPARVRMVGTTLVIDGSDVKALSGSDSISLPVVDPQILPCTPKVRLVDPFVELSCTGNELPGVLTKSLGAGGIDGRVGPGGPGGPGNGSEPEVDSELTPPATLELPPESETTSSPGSTTDSTTSTTGGGG